MLLPVQSLAAGYQLACYIQEHTDTDNTTVCHEQMLQPKIATQSTQMQSHPKHHQEMHSSNAGLHDATSQAAPDEPSHPAVKSTKCVIACAQANMAALPNTIASNAIEFVFNHFPEVQMHYASVTLPSLQRPPIRLS